MNMTELPGIRQLYVGTMPFIIIIYYRGLRGRASTIRY